MLLMNEGELLYQGEPKALTQTMAGRSFLMTSPHEGNRKLLQRALKLPQVSDGMIQGKSVRLILKKEATPDDIRHADGMPEININETTPRFEDAFIDLLGGAGTSESPLGAILHTVEGTPVSYTHLRAHETGRNLVCRLLLEKKNKTNNNNKQNKTKTPKRCYLCNDVF